MPGLWRTSGAASMADSSQPAIMEIMPTSASGVAPAGGGLSEHAIGATQNKTPWHRCQAPPMGLSGRQTACACPCP